MGHGRTHEWYPTEERFAAVKKLQCVQNRPWENEAVQKMFHCTLCNGRFSTKTELIQHCEQHKVPQCSPYVGSGTYNISGNIGIHTVEAYKNHSVEAYQPRTVEAYQPRTVEVYQPSTVKAYQPDTVEACKPRTVEGHKLHTVETCKPCTVEGHKPNTAETYEAYEPSYSQYIPPTFACIYCPKVLKTRQTLKNHLSKHTGLYMYPCKTCSKGFNTESRYMKHLAEHASDSKAQHP